MSRDQLVRVHFEVQRDLHWATTLEPRFRRHNVDPDAMRHYREAWNVFAEDRDWDWWQDEARHSSNEELKAEIAECKAELKALEMHQPDHDQSDSLRQTLQTILSGDAVQPAPEPARTQNNVRDR